MKRFKFTALFIIIIMIITSASCDVIDDKVCLAIFISIGISVETEDGTPVVFDEFTVSNSRTNRIIDLCESDSSFCDETGIHGNPELGQYTIFHDGVRNEIWGPAMGIIAEGRKGDLTFERLFVVGDNGCNVELLAGETTVVIE